MNSEPWTSGGHCHYTRKTCSVGSKDAGACDPIANDLEGPESKLRIAVLVAVVGLVGAGTGVVLADTSPGGHYRGSLAVPWRAPNRLADGSIVTDEAGQSSPGQTDLVMGPAGDEGTLPHGFRRHQSLFSAAARGRAPSHSG